MRCRDSKLCPGCHIGLTPAGRGVCDTCSERRASIDPLAAGILLAMFSEGDDFKWQIPRQDWSTKPMPDKRRQVRVRR